MGPASPNMTLAAILGICLLCPPGTLSGGYGHASQAAGQATQPPTATQSPASQEPDNSSGSQTPASQAKPPAQTQTAPATTGSGQSPSSPSKPAPAKHRRRRKATTPNCADPATPNKQTAEQPNSPPAAPDSSALKPCPPKKTVVHNGGTDEPSVQLIGTAPAKQTSQGTTAQLVAATEENLKKLSGRELKADQQQTLNQVREFLEQSKQATAAGDLERGQSLASKARLLSDELVKP